VGKSALAIQYVHGKFVSYYDVTIEDLYRKLIHDKDEPVMCEIMDTAGTEAFMAMRDLYIRNGEGFIIVFSIAARSTFQEVREIVQQIVGVKDCNVKKIPLIIVGNKTDLEATGGRDVQKFEGEELAAEFGATYMETSARDNINVDPIFEKCLEKVRAVKEPQSSSPREESRKDKKKKRKAKCVIL